MSNAPFSIRRLPVGAEVLGRVAGKASDPEVRAALYQAWLDNGILLFKDVETTQEHLTLSRCFGELEVHPVPEARSNEHPLLIEIGGSKVTPSYVYDGTDIRVNRIPWHRDTAFTPNLCKGAMLRMLEVPASEGETLLADTAMAYDDLPEYVKKRLDGLEYKATLRLGTMQQTRVGALWKTARPTTKEEDPRRTKEAMDDSAPEKRYPSVVHPVVLIHPESGRKCIFLSPTYVDYFIGLEPSDSDALLEYLVAHMTKARYVYKHRWSVNDAIIWDNRRFMHAAPGNKIGDRRRGLRTTLADNLHVGRYFDPSVTSARGPALTD